MAYLQNISRPNSSTKALLLLLTLVPLNVMAQQNLIDGKESNVALSRVYLRLALLDISHLHPSGLFFDSAPESIEVHRREETPNGLFSAIYDFDAPLMAGWMNVTDRTALPVIFGAVPVFWASSLLSTDDSSADAAWFTVAWMGAAGSTLIFKRIAKRPRPYASNTGIVAKGHYSADTSLGDYSSMPSGHAALSAMIASFVSMEKPTWYVIAPATIWTLSVSTSRIWHGVHYPVDVLAGSVLGGLASVIVHKLR